MAGAMIGAIAGAAGGDMASGMASAAQYQASKHERNRAWDRAQTWARIEPGLRMEGLQRAGLNPILAATGGFPSRGYSEPGHAQPGQLPQFSRDTAQRVLSSAKQAQIMDAEVGRARALEQIANSEAAAAEFLPSKAMWESDIAAERWGQMRESIGLLKAQSANTIANTRRTDVDRRIAESGLPSARAIEELYEKYPILRQVGSVIKDLTSGR